MRRNLAVSLSYQYTTINIDDKARHLSLPGAVFPNPQAQGSRFDAHFSSYGAKDLWDIRESVIPSDELKRIAKLEHLDEIEELKLVLGHYCVAWGGKGCLTGISL
jgi:[phosphatase 2A protein]-leucine-carboxy methyltransferase